jgi:hypothetical protein
LGAAIGTKITATYSRCCMSPAPGAHCWHSLGDSVSSMHSNALKRGQRVQWLVPLCSPWLRSRPLRWWLWLHLWLLCKGRPLSAHSPVSHEQLHTPVEVPRMAAFTGTPSTLSYKEAQSEAMARGNANSLSRNEAHSRRAALHD